MKIDLRTWTLILAGAACLTGAASAPAQSSGLPSTPLTAQDTGVAMGVPALKAGAARRAVVTYADGRLGVVADNSSLHQILREIIRQTGMKVQGGVREERVYGKYGPAPVSEVLTGLLEGTGSNIFLREGAAGQPVQLTLTQRIGEPTPPDPNAAAYNQDAPADERPERLPYPVPRQVVQGSQLPFSQPAVTPPITSIDQTPTTPPPGGIVDPPTVAPATEPGTTPGPQTQSTGTSDTASPNGVNTPQQIYQQLQLLRQQQQQQPPAPQ